MKRIIAIAAIAALAGCQTRMTAKKNAESVATVNGRQIVLSGGWEFTARSPLWATEGLRGLAVDIGEGANHVGVCLDEYHRDLSTNSVVMTQHMIEGATTLCANITSAILTAGGKTGVGAISSLVSKFISSGGNVDNAKVDCANGNCTITDGNVTCSDGACWESE